MKIGKSLKHFRELRGHTQDSLGTACGIKREYICKLERGSISNPTVGTLGKILSVLNVSLGKFFTTIEKEGEWGE
jgi:transcriptional regulator with XRE-family HTH domain